MGMERPTVNVFRREPRKRKTTSMASEPPRTAALRTPSTDFSMKSAWFWIVLTCMSEGTKPEA